MASQTGEDTIKVDGRKEIQAEYDVSFNVAILILAIGAMIFIVVSADSLGFNGLQKALIFYGFGIMIVVIAFNGLDEVTKLQCENYELKSELLKLQSKSSDLSPPKKNITCNVVQI